MKKRNPIAKQLHSPRYRKRVVAMKTIYSRKKTEKKPRSKTDYEVEDRATRTKSVIPKSKTEVTEDRRINWFENIRNRNYKEIKSSKFPSNCKMFIEVPKTKDEK